MRPKRRREFGAKTPKPIEQMTRQPDARTRLPKAFFVRLIWATLLIAFPRVLEEDLAVPNRPFYAVIRGHFRRTERSLIRREHAAFISLSRLLSPSPKEEV